MFYFLFPEKDATIYQDVPTQNAGLDQILEISKDFIFEGESDDSGSIFSYQLSRILIQFDLSELSSSIVDGDIPTGSKYFLNLSTTEASELALDYTIEAFPVSESWEMGTGFRGNIPIVEDGVSWEYRDGITGSLWAQEGGSFISGSGNVATQSFSYQTSDISMDVTNIVNKWLDGTYDNNGFLLRFSGSLEDDEFEYGFIQFFSNETHTIYRPRIEVVWDDQVFNPPVSESFTAITASDDWVREEITGYVTNSFYTGSGISGSTGGDTGSYTWPSGGLYRLTGSDEYVTLNAFTQSVFSFTSSLGLFGSHSTVITEVSQGFTYTSGSNTAVSYSIVTSSTEQVITYTASLGSEYSQSQADTNIYMKFAPRVSQSWTFNSNTGVYLSQSFVAQSQSFTYTSESITGYSTQSFNISDSLKPLGDIQSVITVKDIFPEYRQDNTVRFDIFAREKFPAKTFQTGSWRYTRNSFYLPTSSFYSIRDAYTEEETIPFGNYSKISTDTEGSYFNLRLNGIEPERFYRILLKIESGSLQRVIDDDFIFKVVR